MAKAYVERSAKVRGLQVMPIQSWFNPQLLQFGSSHKELMLHIFCTALFTDALTHTGYTAMNNRITGNQSGKVDMLWPVLRKLSQNMLEGLRKTMEPLSKDSQSAAQDSNLDLLNIKHESQLLLNDVTW